MHDCWDLLNNQKEYYLPRGEREPDSAYKRRIDAALPSGCFRDACDEGVVAFGLVSSAASSALLLHARQIYAAGFTGLSAC